MKSDSRKTPRRDPQKHAAAKRAPDPLATYRAKRDVAKSGEPKGKAEAGQPQGWQFVVQKHDARRLHFDLRLELDGVLLSWAVTRGPSFVVTEKRLAVRTEDHPMKYLDFEGVIPKGEYGGGTMIVWDRGEWEPRFDPHWGLAKGHLEFELRGQRLNGGWHLVRMKPRRGETKEQWLLIKASDDSARDPSETDIVEAETASLLSGLTNDDLAKTPGIRVDHQGRSAIAEQRRQPLPDATRLKGARKAMLPVFVEPSLAEFAQRPPAGSSFVHEIKLNGYRLQARIDGGEVKLLSRKGLDWTHRFKSVAAALKRLRLPSALLDGEVVVEDAAGISSFNELVTDLQSGRQDRFRYFAFDLLYLDGTDIRGAPLEARKAALGDALGSAPAGGPVVYGEHIEAEGGPTFEHACRLGLEGIVSKRRDAPYRSGRGSQWFKSKCVKRQEFVVIGYVPSSGASRAIGSLVLGFYEDGQLIHAGRVGTGFSQEDARAFFEALEGIRADRPSFDRKLVEGAEKQVRWVEPRLVVEVEYRGWSKDGVLFHSSFRGLREDKDPLEIVREDDMPKDDVARPERPRLTHPDRLLWPEEGITKQGLADYYVEIADFVLPHLVDRPLSLMRCPGGIAAKCFFAKHPFAGLTEIVRRVPTGEKEPMLAISSLEGLLELVQSNVLEIHPWGSTVSDLERPDRLIFDLDPGEEVAWAAMIEAARELRQRLADLDLVSFVKTTGGKGLHVVVPLKPSLDWEAAKAFTRELAEKMAADSPSRYLANMSKSKRKGRIFIDYLRNGRGATAVAAFSTRARPKAGISTPLDWDELSEAVKADHFRLDNISRRLHSLKRDPWDGFFSLRQLLPSGGKMRAKARQ